jgi:hypothetical protein
MRHRIRFVQLERVFEAFGPDAREGAPDHGELARSDFVMKIDGEGGYHTAEAARVQVAQRHAGMGEHMPTRVVEESGVVTDVHMPVVVAIRRHHDGAVRLEPLGRHKDLPGEHGVQTVDTRVHVRRRRQPARRRRRIRLVERERDVVVQQIVQVKAHRQPLPPTWMIFLAETSSCRMRSVEIARRNQVDRDWTSRRQRRDLNH